MAETTENKADKSNKSTRSRTPLALAIAGLILVVITGLVVTNPTLVGEHPNITPGTTTTTTTIMLSNGLIQSGDVVCLNYIGRFENGTIFDTNLENVAKDAGIYDATVPRPYKPMCFAIGSGMVIKGFEDGVRGMAIGDTRNITVPPEEGYSYGPLAGKTLIFEVNLLEIKEPSLEMIVLNDKRCKDCDISGIIRQLEIVFPGIKTKELDYNTEEGRKLYDDLGLEYLPAVLFDESVKSEDGYNNIKKYLEEVGGYQILRIGARFDPTAEICDNGVDDNGNGLVDCEDDSCKKEFACMPKKTRPDVELFVMSYCPYGLQLEKGILPVLDLLKDKINFSVKFCTYAMHGKKELDEEILQYCIEKEFSNKYLDYLSCFLEDGDTKRCLEKVEIDQEKLDSCIKQTDEEFKITKNYEDKSTWISGRFPRFDIYLKENEEYGIRGSPGFVVNGVVGSTGRDPASLLKAICLGFDKEPEECSRELSSSTPSPGFGFSRTGSGSSGGCGA